MSEIETLSLLFDSAWYLATYQDVAAANCDPLDHYLAFGYKEGRNPNRFFNTHFYLETYPDLASCHLNPFIHYILYGASEGRLPRPSEKAPLPQITFEIFLQDEKEIIENTPSVNIPEVKEEIIVPPPKEDAKKITRSATDRSKKTVRKPAPHTKTAALANKRKKI